jgi:hypothetical protein
MSLKAFHIFFIALSIVLSIGVGSWGISNYLAAGGTGPLALGIVFCLVGLSLLIYGRSFLKKMKEIEA